MVVVGGVLYLLDLRGRKKASTRNGRTATPPAPQPESEPCTDSACTLRGLCPNDAVMACASDEVVYYDDEELDAFKGRAAEDYSAEETEQFRDVLYTLMAADLIGWEQSLRKRGVEMPRAIRDELIMLYQEQSS